MTDQSPSTNDSLSSSEPLLREDLKPYIVNLSDSNIILFANQTGPRLSIFALPILGVVAILSRKRHFVIFNLIQAFIYQSLGILLTFFIWLLWVLITGTILLLVRDTHLDENNLYWFAILLALIPSFFAVIWIAYPLLYAADLDRLAKKTNGHILYPRLTDWLDKEWEKWKIGAFLRNNDQLGIGALLMWQGARNLALERHDKAIGYYSAAIKIYREIKDKQRELEGLSALFVAESTARKPPAILETLHLIAHLAKEMGKNKEYEEAMETLLEVTNEEKDNEELRMRLNSLVLECPDDYVLLYARANLHDSRGEFELARQDAARAVEIQPEDPNVLYVLGISLERLNMYETEIDIFSRAIHQSPKTASLYRHRALAYLELGKLAVAKEDIEYSVHIDPRHVYTRGLQALGFLAGEEFSKAERYFQIAANQEENNNRWQLGLALAKLGLGDLDSALQIFSETQAKASMLDKDFARRWLNRLAPNLSISEEQIGLIHDLLRK